MEKTIFKKNLIESHFKAGIFFSFIFYFSLFFGTLCIVSPYLSIWETESRYFRSEGKKLEINLPVERELNNQDWPELGIILGFPNTEEPALSIGHRFVSPVFFNPETGEKLKSENPVMKQFFMDLHLGKFLGKKGSFIFGLGAVGFIFLMINGHILVFLTKRKNHKKSFKNLHSVLARWITPFIFVIILSGAFIGAVADLGTGLSTAASGGEIKSVRGVLGRVIFKKEQIKPSLNIKVPMQNLNYLYDKALKDFPGIDIKGAKINRWGDKNASISFFGPHKEKKFITGWQNRLSIKYSLFDGSIINKDDLDNIHFVKKIMSLFYYFHFLDDSGVFTRLVLFLLCIGFCASINSSIFSWCRKKENQKNSPYSGFLISRTALAFFSGVVPGTGVFILMGQALPDTVTDRVLILKSAFFLSWQISFIWTLWCVNFEKAKKGIFYFSGIIFIMIPFIHGIKTGFFPWIMISKGLWPQVFVDSGFFISGALLIYTFREKVS